MHTPAAVTKLLDQKDYRSNVKAKNAIMNEGRALAGAGTWREGTILEKAALVSKSKQSGVKIHMGELLSICSV